MGEERGEVGESMDGDRAELGAEGGEGDHRRRGRFRERGVWLLAEEAVTEGEREKVRFPVLVERGFFEFEEVGGESTTRADFFGCRS